MALKDDTKLFGHFENLAKELGMVGIIELVNLAKDVYYDTWSQAKLRDLLHSKLHCIFEKADKSRVIAIGDYYTQAILLPFMQVLQEALKLIPNDFTYNQDAGFEFVKEMSRAGRTLYSLDLSKATDRLPVKLQVRILGYYLGDKVANL